jgi:hypothetical protein
MGTDILSNLANVLTSKTDKTVPLYLNTTVPLLDFMDKGTMLGKTVTFEGEDYFYIPAQTQLPESVVWGGENVALPTASQADYGKFRLSWKKMHGVVEFSEEIIDLTKGAYALVNGFKQNTMGLLKAARLNLDAALHGDGSGVLATCVSVSTDDPSAGYDTVTVDSTRFLRPGMVLDGYDSESTPTHDADGIVVGKILTDTTFVTTIAGGADSVDSATKLYLEGSHDGSAERGASAGLSNIVDDSGVFQNVNRSNYTWANAKVLDGDTPGTAQAFTEDRLNYCFDIVYKGSYGDIPDLLYTSVGVRNSYKNHLKDLQQPVEVLPARTGFPAGLKYVYDGKEIPIYASVKAVPETMFGLSKAHLLKYFGKMGWNTTDGLLKWKTGYLAFYAVWRGWFQHGTDWPEANFRYNDITETTS